MVAMIEQRWQFHAPAFVGDVVTAHYEVKSNATTSNGRSAKVEIGVVLRNQDGTTLLEGSHVYLIRRRS